MGYDTWDLRSAGKLHAHPGPVDNSSLFKCKCNLRIMSLFTINFSSGSTQEILKLHLMEELDYYLLPKQAWDFLVSIYGISHGSQPIPRLLISCFHCFG